MQTAEYDAPLKRYPVPYESRMVSTTFGTTPTLISGNPAASPVVLVHGISVNALFRLSIIAPLSDRYRVNSIELLGQSGKSAARRYPERVQRAEGDRSGVQIS